MHDKGIDSPRSGKGSRPWVFGRNKALVILVDFADKPSGTDSTYFDNLIFGSKGKTVRSYYDEVSYGRVDIVTATLPSKLGWSRMPNSYSYYSQSNGFGAYPTNAQGLVEDAIKAVDPKVDFSSYDGNRDGYVDSLFVVHAGTGAELSGSSSDIWSHAWSVPNGQTKDGVTVSRYSMEPEYWFQPGDMTHGVYVHELGHVFGLPDLYDYTYQSGGVGAWSVMASGSWNGSWGDTPSRLDAWSASKLGIVQPVNVTSNQTVSIPCIDSKQGGKVYRLQQSGLTGGSEYWMVENRQQRGTDAALPGSGLLIWHIDESQYNNNDRTHFMVDVEEAHGAFQHMEQAWTSGDSNDCWPGLTANARTFSDFTCPSALFYSGVPSGIAVGDISDNGPIMSARLSVK